MIRLWKTRNLEARKQCKSHLPFWSSSLQSRCGEEMTDQIRVTHMPKMGSRVLALYLSRVLILFFPNFRTT